MAETFEVVWTATARTNARLKLEANTSAWDSVTDGYNQLADGHLFVGGELVVTAGTRKGDRADLVAQGLGAAVEVHREDRNPWPPPPPPPRVPGAKGAKKGENPWPPPPPPPLKPDSFALELQGWFEAMIRTPNK